MNKKGFTLIELLIVISILAILSVLGVGNFISSRMKAQDLSRKSDLQTIAKSLEAYVNDHRSYPLSNNGLIVCKSGNITCDWGTPFVDDKNTMYAAKLPKDPSSVPYWYTSNGTTFSISARLLNTNDPSIIPAFNCGTSTECNYKITSTNQ